MSDDIIGDILVREGGSKATNDPKDGGGRTQWGISETSNPEAWKDGKVTEQEAREIYERKYVRGPGFDKIKDKGLRAQLIDFGVTSGPFIAIQKLQHIVGVEEDGVLGPETLKAIDAMHPSDVSDSLVALRVIMIGKIVSKNPSQLKFLTGWLTRAVEFLG